MIVLNGEPFVRYNLRALYPFAHQIIVVEGAAPSAKSIATPDGHSTDSTRATIRKFQEEEDIEHKVSLISAEDEGYPNGFWPGEKDEMSRAYAKRATGNYIWQVDSDEFYLQQDMDRIIEMMVEDPSISAITFPMRTFWGAPQYLVDGFFLRPFVVHRLFRWAPGFRYITHRPPTVVDENGKNLRDNNSITAIAMAKRGIFMYHYELLLPKQVREKCKYYMYADWTDTLRGLDQWMNKSYFSLDNPFHVHMVYNHLSWLEQFKGEHPPQILKMVDSVSKGQFPDIEMRPIADVEKLLSSWSYAIQRTFLKTLVPLNNLRLNSLNAFKATIKKTAIWPYLRNMKTRMRGGVVPVSINRVSPELFNGWKDDTIPVAQNQLVSQEIQDMYAGRVLKPYSVLAEAVRITGIETGTIIEVGCATGYYYEILKYLLDHEISYQGIDYSEAMVAEARRKYPEISFKVGDAMALPLKDNCCDILISGGVLLHVPDYKQAIAESARASRKWVIFHRSPMTSGETCYYKKKAYGVPCIEVHFGEAEFMSVCKSYGLRLKKEFEITSGDDDHMITYLFQKNESI